MSDADITADMSTEAFEAFARIAHGNWGLVLMPEKRAMVASRLRHRVRACGLKDFEDYSDLVQSTSGAREWPHMISALTTNVSHFFREDHHFEMMARELGPRIREKVRHGERIRIWSAGCSNGQEPFSIAMYLVDVCPELATADFRILATDIDPKVVEFAKDGVYDEAMVRGLPAGYRERYTTPEKKGVRIGEQILSLVSFRTLNLLESWPMKGVFDAVFCRNVVIYFDLETQEELWPRFQNTLGPRGLLFLGHSERIQDCERFGFSTFGATAFIKSTGKQSQPYEGAGNGAA